MKSKKVYIAILLVLVVLTAIAATYRVWLEGVAKFLVVKDELSPADAIVVLGGGGAGHVRHGVKLYESGYASRIIVTGMKIRLPGLVVTWSQLAMQEAASMGVPEDVFILEERPSSTYEDAKYVKEDMLDRGFKSAIVVSSPYHMRRTRMIFRKLFKDQEDISLKFSPAGDSEFRTHRWWTRETDMINVFNEYCKTVLYIFKYMI